jgi:hypothetical protein
VNKALVVILRHLFLASLVALLVTTASADELWVSNQPFPGTVRGSGQDMMVELRMFIKVMRIEADDQGDIVIIGGFPIPVEEFQGIRFVHLRDMVDAAGLRISASPDLGTVDVRRASAGTGYKGEWNALSPGGPSDGASRGTVTNIAGDFFSLRIPSRFLVVAEPEYLQSEESENARAASLNDGHNYMGSRMICIVSQTSDVRKGGLVMAYIPGLPEKVTAKNEAGILDLVKDEVVRGGVQQIGPMSTMNIAGNRFHRLRVRQTEDGVTEDTEINIHFSNKHDSMILLMIRAPKRLFNRVAPRLRLVINNFRIR